MSIVTADGGLTALGYGLSILAAALFFFIAGMISRNQKTKISARQLVFCGTAMALAYIASYIRLIPKMPYGVSGKIPYQTSYNLEEGLRKGCLERRPLYVSIMRFMSFQYS